MPTPAVHLVLAQRMLREDDLLDRAGCLLHQHKGAFLLGHTAPDVRTVSGQARQECHFCTVPRTSERPAHRALLAAHPMLGRAEALSRPQLAFVAGYMAHLLVDELWLDAIFQPFFLRDGGPVRERLFLHNVLRTWMDYRAQDRLEGDVGRMLRGVRPRDWLPFVADEDLVVWRDWLAEQLGAGRTMDTAGVLARRSGVHPGEIDSVARSPAQMRERVFSRIPRSFLRSFWCQGYDRSLSLVEEYVGALAAQQASSAPSGPAIFRSAESIRGEGPH